MGAEKKPSLRRRTRRRIRLVGPLHFRSFIPVIFGSTLPYDLLYASLEKGQSLLVFVRRQSKRRIIHERASDAKSTPCLGSEESHYTTGCFLNGGQRQATRYAGLLYIASLVRRRPQGETVNSRGWSVSARHSGGRWESGWFNPRGKLRVEVDLGELQVATPKVEAKGSAWHDSLSPLRPGLRAVQLV